MITIEAGTPETPNKATGWDFPIEELDYLLEEHDGEAFVLWDGRLYEKEA